jgi:hypothetical protein
MPTELWLFATEFWSLSRETMRPKARVLSTHAMRSKSRMFSMRAEARVVSAKPLSTHFPRMQVLSELVLQLLK